MKNNDINLFKIIDNELVGVCDAKYATTISLVLGEQEPFIPKKKNTAVMYSKNIDKESFFVELEIDSKKAIIISYRINGKSCNENKVSSELNKIILNEIIKKYKHPLKEIMDALQAISSWNFIEEIFNDVTFSK